MKKIRLSPNSKVPVAGESWKEAMTEDPDVVSSWLAQDFNVGLPLEENGRSVLDFDGLKHEGGREFAREFYRRHRELCTFIVETAAGNIHFHFKGKTKTRKIYEDGHDGEEGHEIGDIKGNGFVVWEGSKIRGGVYRILVNGPLPPASALDEIFPIPEREVTTREPEPDGVMRVRRAEEYGKAIFAVSGSSGHNNTFRFVCFMRDIGLTEGEAYLVLERWNETNADPKWSVKELSWKVRSAFKKVKS